MGSVEVVTQAGGSAGSVELAAALFDVDPDIGVMHQVVTAQLAARRTGSHSTLTRAEVAGGGGKPWRQKGTGRARHGSNRTPQWRGGGVAHGPKPRHYKQRTPKKMKRLALASALSDRARDGNIIVVEKWHFDAPRTSAAVEALAAIGAEGKVLLVLGDDESSAWLSFRNLPWVHCLRAGELNTYDVLDSDVVVFTLQTLTIGSSAMAGVAAAPEAPGDAAAHGDGNIAENDAEDIAGNDADQSAGEDDA